MAALEPFIKHHRVKVYWLRKDLIFERVLKRASLQMLRYRLSLGSGVPLAPLRHESFAALDESLVIVSVFTLLELVLGLGEHLDLAELGP